MQRNFLRGLLICVIPCIVAAIFAVRLDKYRLGIDLAGGTILVYELNLDALERRKQQQRERGDVVSTEPGLDRDQMVTLAAQIKRRIDPTDIKNVTVRPLGRTRFEIILPYTGAAGGRENLTAADIAEVKTLITQMGVLEFRILANGTDDSEGIQRAREFIEQQTPAKLEELARKGDPPPGPPGDFHVKIGDSEARVEYKWVELAREERQSLRLSNSFAGEGGLWAVAERNRGKVFWVDAERNPTSDPKLASLVFFSRDVNKSSPSAEKEVAAVRTAVRDGKLPETLLKNADGTAKTDQQVYEAMLASPEAVELINPKRIEYYLLTRVTPQGADTSSEAGRDSMKVEGDITLTATADTDQSFRPTVAFTLNSAGGQQFGKITRRNKPTGTFKRHLAILLDEKIVSAPTLDGEITNRGQITGFDRKGVDRLVQILRSGALSQELRDRPVSENTIGPTLGDDTIRKGVWSVAGAFITILLFMVFYYRFAGLVASVALFANLLLTIGFMVAVNAAFTLPGLAGLVLCLGMAVDANVLIYERLREERDKGANLATAIRNGYDRAFLTIIDTHLTSIFTSVVLYTFGNDNLKGFAITLAVGLIISLFTSLYMTRLMFDYCLHRRWLTELRMLRLFGKINVHPMKYRWFFMPLTVILTVLGLGLFVLRGEDVLNVDFRGGTVFTGNLKKGEERALNTVGDKVGFRDLLGEDNQKNRLAVQTVEWVNKPPVQEGKDRLETADLTRVNNYLYTITYSDGKTTTVLLSQKPAGDTPEEMDADVKRRASELPDVSVEQVYLSERPRSEFTDGKSEYFTIRTTEKQPDMVRAALDRLFRDEQGKLLLASASMTYQEEPEKRKDRDGKDVAVPVIVNGEVELEFSQPTTRDNVRDLLERSFVRVLRGDTKAHPFVLVGDETTSEKGRFKKMKLSIVAHTAFDLIKTNPVAGADQTTRNVQLTDLAKVLADAKQNFDSSPIPERLEVFDSQLAQETRTKAFYAIVASWIAILLYLWFRFGNWTFGLAAVLCLIHDLCFTLGAIAACHYLFALPGMSGLGIHDFKIDLAAVAALLTLVGYSVNEIIVNFARIREVRGKNPNLTPDMINTSVSQTLSRTILTSMTVLLVSIVLYVFGGEGVHLFAFVMIMGVLISTYSSIFVASPLLLMFGEGQSEGATEAAAEEPSEKDGGDGKDDDGVVEG